MLRLCSLALISLVAFTGCGSQSRTGDASAPAPAPQAADQGAQPQEVAQNAPPIELDDLTGKHFSLRAEKGKVVFLDFWATWCPPCRMSSPEVAKLEADYGSKGVDVISLSVDDDIGALKRYVADKGMKSRVIAASGSTAPDYYGVRAIPRFVLIDKEGRVAAVWEGFSPGMPDKWRSEIDRLLKT